MKFGDRLRQSRIKKGIKIQELSRRSKVSASYISQLENGKLVNDPMEDTIEKLADGLDIDKNVLLAESTTANSVNVKQYFDNFQDATKMRVILKEIDKDKSLVNKIFNLLKKK